MTTELEWEFPQYVREAVGCLTTDPRAIGLNLQRSKNYLDWIALEFQLATTRNSWALTTQRERTAWAERLKKLYADFLSHLRCGPVSPEDWGTGIPAEVVFIVIDRLGYLVPEPTEDGNSDYTEMLHEIHAAINEEGTTPIDLLGPYLECVLEEAAAFQRLKKPGDEKAPRADFICRMKVRLGLSARDLAIIASILFEDEAIDERLVRRLTSTRGRPSKN
jgi:hypothetical protein